MIMQQIISSLLIAGGAIVMLFSIMGTRKLLTLIANSPYQRYWRVLVVLMGFFCLGYMGAIVLVMSGINDWLLILMGTVFLFGALFVYLVVTVGGVTIQDLNETMLSKDMLEEAVSTRTAELTEKNAELMHSERIMMDLRDKALQANQAKSEFLANMSHEIRTPLNAIIGMSGLMGNTTLSAQQRDFVSTIHQGGDTLLALINAILDFSKIEANQMVLDKSGFYIHKCVENALDIVAPRAADKGIEVAYISDPRMPSGYVGDMNRIQQILTNLLGNAVKFTDEGEVVVSIVSKPADPPQPEQGDDWWELLFSVRDTGIGIPEESVDSLFEMFTQADSSTTRKYEGTGLGLAISRQLVEMMHGRIWVTSKLGEGSTFYFSIRLQMTDEYTADYEENPNSILRGKRLLIVDDNPTNRQIVRLQAQSWGMETVEVASGFEALTLLQKNELFDLGVLDMSMPEMDGVELAKRIRGYHDKDSLPLVMLTSLGLSREDIESDEFSALLTKPIKPSMLYNTLLGALGNDVVMRGAQDKKDPFALDHEMAERCPMRLLLVEDNEMNQKLALLLLANLGYTADLATNGREAVDAVLQNDYDVVLMDSQMPVMDGVKATLLIHEELGEKRPYIIALTADVVVQARRRYLKLGFDDYVSKPINPQFLVEALEEACRVVGTKRPPVASALAISPAEPEVEKRDLPPVLDPAGLDRLRRTLGQQADQMLPVLLASFETDIAKLMSDADTALAADDRDDLRRAAHTIKSNAATFGAMRLSALALELEQATRDDKKEQYEILLTQLKNAVPDAVDALQTK